jgi:recombination protein RecT
MSTALTTTARKDVQALLGKMKEQFKMALPAHMDADRFIRVALTAINKQPLLLQCTRDSLLEKLMDLSQLGLEADSVSGLAYLIPFKDKRLGYICQLIVGYKGLVELAYRHPKVKSIRWGVVHEHDTFEYEEGLDPKLKHIPTDEDNEGPLIKAYAIAELDGGARTWIVLNKKQIMKAKASSRGADSDYSPWRQWEDQMWAKTAVRALSPRIPKSPELIRALNRDDEMSGVIDLAPEDSRLLEAEPAKSGSEPTPLPESQTPTATSDDPLE